MCKPKLFIYDWKSKFHYKPISDVLKLNISLEFPDSVDDLAGVIMHNFALTRKENYRFIEKLKQKNIPLFIENGPVRFLLTIQEMEEKNLLYEKVYLSQTYNDLFSDVKKNLLRKLT